jgi:glycosyltransferase involved in cell wall biosynthesis
VQTALHHYYLGTRALAGEGRAALTQVLQVAPKPPFQPGDALFLPGTDWGDDRTMAVLPQLRAEYGLRVASIIYDISPLRCPHLLAPYLKDVFAAWLPSALANSDVILTISNYSRDDLRTYCATRGLFCPPVEVIRLGDEPLMDQEAQRPTTLPQDDRPFAMMVSTLSLHKNQWLLVEVWRRLIRRYGSRVPRLLLVGGAGWRHEALIEEVAGDPGLRDHVVHLHGIPDAQLRWLYRQCRFTLYPSWYEGWGLPVAESLVNGKPCIASSATSLPEVGGDLVDYHDPYDASSLVTLVEQASFDPVWLRERQDRIRRDYRQTSWSSCANQTIGILEKYLGLVPQTIPKAA